VFASGFPADGAKRRDSDVTFSAAGLKERQDDYIDCWKGLRRHFDLKRKP
jgi:homogentisate 1,2-dioxygenase